MNTKRRVIAATAAATAGLFLAACDNTETEQAPEAPAETTAPLEEEATTDTGGMDAGTETGGTGGTGGAGGDTGSNTGADGTVPEGDTGGDTDTGN